MLVCRDIFQLAGFVIDRENNADSLEIRVRERKEVALGQILVDHALLFVRQEQEVKKLFLVFGDALDCWHGIPPKTRSGSQIR